MLISSRKIVSRKNKQIQKRCINDTKCAHSSGLNIGTFVVLFYFIHFYVFYM